MLSWSRILGAVLAWWCLALTAQGAMRDAEHQHAESAVDQGQAAAAVDKRDFGLDLAQRGEVNQGEKAPFESIRDDQRGEVPLVHSVGANPYRALMVTFDAGFGLAVVPRAHVALLAAWVTSLAQGTGAPASCWRFGSSGGPRAP